MIDRLEILTDLNVSHCWCPDCQWLKVNTVADAIEAGHLHVENDGDAIVGLHLTPSGRKAMPPSLPWGAAA